MGELAFLWKLGLKQSPPVLACALDEIAQPMVALRPHDEVHHRGTAHDFPALGLRDAARHGDERVFAAGAPLGFQLADAAKLGINLLGRLFADVAGVEDDQIGLLHAAGGEVARAAERLADALGIIDVHLAAERLDEHLLGCGHLNLPERERKRGGLQARIGYLRTRFKGTPNSSRRCPTKVKPSSRATRSCRRSISSLRNSMTLPLSISIK